MTGGIVISAFELMLVAGVVVAGTRHVAAMFSAVHQRACEAERLAEDARFAVAEARAELLASNRTLHLALARNHQLQRHNEALERVLRSDPYRQVS